MHFMTETKEKQASEQYLGSHIFGNALSTAGVKGHEDLS